MRLRGYLMVLLTICASAPLAIAQSAMNAATEDQYVPRLADIMSIVQLRHMKLWFAGSSPNWELAAFEFHRLKASLVDAASLYPSIPATSVMTMAKPIQSIGEAIEAKDSRKFATAFNDLTGACNACHQSIGRGFIVMRVPTASPFSDQVFPPQAK